MTIEISIKVNIQRFDVPSTVNIDNSSPGTVPLSPNKVKLSAIAPEVLEDLCDKFRVDIFKAAGQKRITKQTLQCPSWNSAEKECMD